MSNNLFTLDSLRDEAQKEFEPVKIALSDGTEITLRNLLLLGEKDRETVMSSLERINKSSDDGSEQNLSLTDIDDLVDAATAILSKVATEPRKLIKELNGEVGLVMRVLRVWMEGTQAGEAQSSPA